MKRLLYIVILAFFFTGCGIIKVNKSSSSQTALPIGVYKTVNAGETWEPKSNIYSVRGEVKNFNDASITTLVQDPGDPSTLYAGTTNKGLLYSYNGGEGWFSALGGKGVINAIAVDPGNKCTVYAAIHNKVFKTEDCNRSWKQIHLSSLENEFFTSLTVDPERTNVVYLGTSRGTLIISRDGGVSWQVSVFFPSQISKLLVNPKNTQIIYMATVSNGLYYSKDGGSSWTQTDKIKATIIDRKLTRDKIVATTTQEYGKLKGAKNFKAMSEDPTQPDSLLYSNNYGIFRFTNGTSWEEIQILNKPSEETVNAIAVNPKDPQMLALTTTGAYYTTKDGGYNWTVRALPAAGTPRFLLINSNEPKEVYLGFYKVK